MKASEIKLQPIIEGTKQYVVPLFQRTYSWDRKEWETLWDDLSELCEDEDGRSHFIGSIVTMPTQSVPQGVSKYLLIDGQQRLTTLFVLLSVLRDRAKNLPGTLAAQIEDLLLMNRYQAGDDVFKLLPTQGDRESFMRLMGGENLEAQDQIQRAYQFFDRKVRADSSPSLEALRKVIVDRLVLVSIVLDRDDNPHLIFESLNAKGRSLSQADLIRNYFFMRIHIDNQDKLYNAFWRPMQERLGGSLTEFIRHFLMKGGGVIKQGDVYFALKERADDWDENEVVSYLQEISKYSVYYLKLLHPDEESNTKICEGMKRLNRIEVTTAYPLLLNVYQDYDGRRISDLEFAAILDILENFLIRRFVSGVHQSGLNRIFPGLYAQASMSESLVDGLKEALWNKNYPRDAEFRDRFVAAKLYGAGDRVDKTKLILERLEAAHGHREQVPFEDLTIEHVMPQSLSDWWKANLGSGWEETHETLLDTVGNLTLTAYNTPLSNDTFEKKKTILSKSHIELNAYFGSVERWDEEAIRTRAQTLATQALEVWKFFGPDRDEGKGTAEESVTGKTPIAVVIVGQRIPVATWRDVVQKTLEAMAELDEERFWQIADQFPRFIGRDPSRFRTSRQLDNGAYVETHLSASAIYRLCVQVTQLAEIGPTDWFVEFS